MDVSLGEVSSDESYSNDFDSVIFNLGYSSWCSAYPVCHHEEEAEVGGPFVDDRISYLIGSSISNHRMLSKPNWVCDRIFKFLLSINYRRNPLSLTSLPSPGFPDGLCDSRSVSLIYFTFSSTLWTAAMSHSSSIMVKNLLRGKRVVNLSFRYQSLCWGLPLIVAFLAHHYFQVFIFSSLVFLHICPSTHEDCLFTTFLSLLRSLCVCPITI